MNFAPGIWGIPVVPDTANRGFLFPDPGPDQRVHNIETGYIERWNGSAWIKEIPVASLPGGGRTVPDFTTYLANNASVNVRDYGAVGDGTTDDYAAIAAAIAAAKASSMTKRVYFPAGTYLVGSPFALDISHSGVTFEGVGGDKSVIKRNFNATLFTLTAVLNFEAHGLLFDGNFTATTGKGIVMTGNCNYPIISHCRFVGFSGAHVEYGPDCGYNARHIANQHFTGSGQSDFLTYHVAGPDTTATPRSFVSCLSNGYFKFEGATDSLVTGCFATRYETNAACSITLIANSVWADQTNFNLGTPITIDGANTCVTNCRLANAVVIASTMSGSFIGNIQTGFPMGLQQLTNNAGASVLVLNHALGTGYHWFNKATVNATLPNAEINVDAPSSDIGDANYDYIPDTSPTSLDWATTLTGNRTLTLETTNARPGLRVWVARPAGGAFNLTIGITSTTLAASQWCMVEYNGVFWQVKAKGSLT